VNRRSRFFLFRVPLILALTGLFLYSASVQEVHYLFVHHEVEYNDHCDHHIHSRSTHTDCGICKLVLSSFVSSFEQFDRAKEAFSTDQNTCDLHEALFSRRFSAIALRGPPSLG